MGTYTTVTSSTNAPRERLLLDFGWRFHLGHAADPARDFDFGRGMALAKAGEWGGAARPAFDDSGWRAVDLPHDWVVEQDFVSEGDEHHKSHGYRPVGRNFPENTIGWYRRSFDLPAGDEGRRLTLEFDGVFRDCHVWLNGHLLRRHESGYSSFWFDISDVAECGGRNVLVARVDASQYEGWFYEGAGIYRHVWLTKTGPLHVAHWGTYVTSKVARQTATVTARTRVANESDADVACHVSSALVDRDGNVVAETSAAPARLKAWDELELKQTLQVTTPQLWSVEQPYLYRLVTTIRRDERVEDQYETPVGIRTIRFDADKGFFLNGQRVELKGVCCHQDHAGVGSALPDRLQAFRIERLKEMGCNAYRTSHNAPTPELLDACDRLGMLVMDEQRLIGSSPELLGQVERMIRRDRNHPCIIMWSLGNEEAEAITPRGGRMGRTTLRLVRRLDPTRPTTYASNQGNADTGLNALVDVRGYNYLVNGDIDEYHRLHPKQPIVGSEEASTFSTRGVYVSDAARGYVSAYDVNKPHWGAGAEQWWTYYAARRYLAGAFVWTGFDYRGEPTPYSWPCINSHFGILDTCGLPKDNYYYYQAWWSGKPVLHILPHWTWPGREGQEIDVWVHSNFDRVELLLNGRTFGVQDMPRNGHVTWKVPYEPGTLEARGFKGDKLAQTARVETTGPAARLTLTSDRSEIAADGEDVAVVTVGAVDAQGRAVPTADRAVRFALRGSGRIIGVGNGDPSCHEPDQYIASADAGFATPRWRRSLFNGLAQIIAQASKQPGEIVLTSEADGVTLASVTITVAPTKARPAVP